MDGVPEVVRSRLLDFEASIRALRYQDEPHIEHGRRSSSCACRRAGVSGAFLSKPTRQRGRIVFLEKGQQAFADFPAQRADSVTVHGRDHGDQLHRRAGRVFDDDVTTARVPVCRALEYPAEFLAQGSEQGVERRVTVNPHFHRPW